MSIRWFFSWDSSSWLDNPFILSAIHLSSIEIRWHRINTSLIHVKLVYLYWVPIIEIIFRVSGIKPINIPVCRWILTGASLLQVWGFSSLLGHSVSHRPRWIKKALASFLKLAIRSIKIHTVSLFRLCQLLFKKFILST